MEKIDAAGAFALLERVVAERGGDYVYEKPKSSLFCKYLHGRSGRETPGCGVGLAAINAGVPLAVLRRWDRAEESGIGSEDGIGDDQFTYDAIAVLKAFQRRQDAGVPYRAALSEARAVLNAA